MSCPTRYSRKRCPYNRNIIFQALFGEIGNEHIKDNLPFHTTWKIIEEESRKTILTDCLEIHIIELPKIINLYEENNELLDWLFFLENPISERVIEKMEDNKELKEANEKLIKMSHDEHLQKIAEWREKAILEENTARIHRISRWS